MPDVRAVREPFQLQAGSAATVRVTAGEGVDLSALTMTVTPAGGSPIVADASDDDGARVFTLTAANTTALAAAGAGRVSIADGDDNEWIVGPAWASTEGTPSQDHEVAVTVGAAEIALTISAAIGAGGGAELSDDVPEPLGTAAAGTATKASRADHVHAMPTAADVGAEPAPTARSFVGDENSPYDVQLGEVGVITSGGTGTVATLPDVTGGDKGRRTVVVRHPSSTSDITVSAVGAYLDGTHEGTLTLTAANPVGEFAVADVDADEWATVVGKAAVDEDSIEQAVADWLTENPPEVGDPTHHRAVVLVDPSLDLDGGDFTQVPLVTLDGSTWTTVPRSGTVGFPVAVASGANVGVWEITASGPCAKTTVMGQDVVSVMSGAVGGGGVAVNLVGQNSNGGVSIPALAATSLVLPQASVAWDDVTGAPEIPEVPAWVGQFARPTVIFSRLHEGGDRAWPDGSPITDMVEHTTGAVNLPLYDDAFVLANGELHLVDDEGNPAGDPYPVEDPPRPIVDGIPWNGGTVLALGQSDWENNGPWDLSHNGTAWVANRPTALNGWVTDGVEVVGSQNLVQEGMPFWVGSGNRHKLRVGVWTMDTIVPTDSGQAVAEFHRNRASDTIFTPSNGADWDNGSPRLSSQALDELAARVAAVEAALEGP